MRIVTNDGVLLQGTASEIVEALRERCFLPPETVAVYMEMTASRVQLWNATQIRTTAPELFLADLADAHLLSIEEE